jgi:tetratricopeptide (TPR) repeat protein
MSGPYAELLAMACTALALVLHVFPLPVNVIAADRFLYMPVGALCVVGAECLCKTRPARSLAWGIAGALLVVALGARTYARNRDWADEWSLWKRGCSDSPKGNGLACFNFAETLLDAGYPRIAIRYFEQARNREREQLKYHERQIAGATNNIALAMQRVGRIDEAIAILEKLTEGMPHIKRFRINLALAYARASRFEEARERLREYLATAPNDAVARGYLGKIDQVEGRLRDASQMSGSSAAAERARAWAKLDGRWNAESEWAGVLRDREAGGQLRTEAAVYWAQAGDCSGAQDAMGQYLAGKSDKAATEGLSELLSRCRSQELNQEEGALRQAEERRHDGREP